LCIPSLNTLARKRSLLRYCCWPGGRSPTNGRTERLPPLRLISHMPFATSQSDTSNVTSRGFLSFMGPLNLPIFVTCPASKVRDVQHPRHRVSPAHRFPGAFQPRLGEPAERAITGGPALRWDRAHPRRLASTPSRRARIAPER